MADARLFFAATARNRDAILGVLRRVLPASGQILEIASGSGEHAAHFARHLPQLVFHPSDPEAAHRASIDAWRAHSGLPNLRPALEIHAERESWPLPAELEPCDAIFSANMIHIAPWEACIGLLDGSERHLRRGGRLVLYGPFKRAGKHTAPSNASFDQSLSARDARWGVRDLDVVEREAGERGLEQIEVVEMPANNLCVVFASARNAAQGSA